MKTLKHQSLSRWFILLGFMACASVEGQRWEKGILLSGTTVNEVRSVVVKVLREAEFEVHMKRSGEIVGSTGGGLASGRYTDFILCRGAEDLAHPQVGVRPTNRAQPMGRFVIRVGPSDTGVRLHVFTDFTEYHAGSSLRFPCESTGGLEQRIMTRVRSEPFPDRATIFGVAPTSPNRIRGSESPAHN